MLENLNFSFDRNLKILPFYKTIIEKEVYIRYEPNYSKSIKYVFVETNSNYWLNRDSIKEFKNERRKALISGVVKNWLEQSNGKCEVRFYDIVNCTLIKIEQIIQILNLECIDKSKTISYLENVSIQRIFSTIFSASSSGGAYGGGKYGAYGRLEAWESLAGLVGCPASNTYDIEDTIIEAKNCEWVFFQNSSDWFYQVAWDFGIMCYNKRRNELVVFAATDTD